MARAALLLAFAVLAGPASAQTTSCGWEMGRWVCREQPRSVLEGHNPPSVMDRFNEARERTLRLQQEHNRQAAQQDADQQAITQAMAAERARFEAEARANNREATRRQIASLVQAGDCDGAKRAALDAGDLDLAEQAMRICTPKAP